MHSINFEKYTKKLNVMVAICNPSTQEVGSQTRLGYRIRPSLKNSQIKSIKSILKFIFSSLMYR